MRVLIALSVIGLISATACTTPDTVAPAVPHPSMSEGGCDPQTADEACPDDPPPVGVTPEYFGEHDAGLRGAPGDPAPSAPGLWLGANVVPATCFANRNANVVDGDHDWLDDDCEYQIAWAFAPRMHFGWGEVCGGGEPYWGAKYFPAAGAFVRLVYLLSYYRDCGDAYYGFGGGHTGDSEFLVVDLTFNGSTNHWETQCMFFSAHYNTDNDHSEWACGNQLEFQFRPLTHPTVWISLRKHANYRSRATCGWVIIDYHETCDELHVAMRVPVAAAHNVGSRFAGTQCVASEQRYPSSGRTECFYQLRTVTVGSFTIADGFRGWAPPNSWSGPTPMPYYDVLMSDKFERRGSDWGPGPNAPNWSFSVGISGPASAAENTTWTWTAQPSNGNAPYAYDWYVDGWWVGSGPSLTYTVGGCGTTQEIAVSATDAVGLTASNAIQVWVTGPNGEDMC